MYIVRLCDHLRRGPDPVADHLAEFCDSAKQSTVLRKVRVRAAGYLPVRLLRMYAGEKRHHKGCGEGTALPVRLLMDSEDNFLGVVVRLLEPFHGDVDLRQDLVPPLLDGFFGGTDRQSRRPSGNYRVQRLSYGVLLLKMPVSQEGVSEFTFLQLGVFAGRQEACHSRAVFDPLDPLVEVIPVVVVTFCETSCDDPAHVVLLIDPDRGSPLIDLDLKESLARGRPDHSLGGVLCGVLVEAFGSLVQNWVVQRRQRQRLM